MWVPLSHSTVLPPTAQRTVGVEPLPSPHPAKHPKGGRRVSAVSILQSHPCRPSVSWSLWSHPLPDSFVTLKHTVVHLFPAPPPQGNTDFLAFCSHSVPEFSLNLCPSSLATPPPHTHTLMEHLLSAKPCFHLCNAAHSRMGKVYFSKDVKGVGTELCGHVRVRKREQLMQRSGDGNVPCVLRDIRKYPRICLGWCCVWTGVSVPTSTRPSPEISCLAHPPPLPPPGC